VSTSKLWFKELRDSYREIRQEYIQYVSENKLKRFGEIDPVQYMVDKGDILWEVLMIKVYNRDTDKVKYFPKTYNFIKKIPGCTLAMFSVLPPGKKLIPHTGPSKSVLRYHLSLIVPEDKQNCFLMVNGKKYHWEEGSDVLFDDTYMHHAENNTNQTRVVLFLDIKRKYNNIFLDSINDIVLYYTQFNKTVRKIAKNTSTKNPCLKFI